MRSTTFTMLLSAQVTDTVPEPTRNCIRCLAILKDDAGAYCRRCKAQSALKLCRHLAQMLAWRVLTVDGGGRRVPVALTIGEVTVQEEALPYPLLYEGTRRALPVLPSLEVVPGSDVLARLILLGRCHVCAVAFLLPETEALVLKGEPRIVRSPNPTALHVYATVDGG